jgi:hypothetical protein
VFPVVAEIVPEPPLLSYEIDCDAAVHTAYNVTSEEIANVLAAAREVPPQAAPAAGCVVHQPSNEYPVFASVPEFPNTVTVAPLAYAVESVGAEPDDGEFPL